MTDRYCPSCGELVPSNSVTCPKCYRKIPPDPKIEKKPERETKERNSIPKEGYNRNIALILAVVPGLFGFLGLGQIYRDPRRIGNYILMLIGLLIFVGVVLLISSAGHGIAWGFLSTLGAFPLMIIYAFMYIGALVEVLLNSVIRFDFRM